MARSAFRRSFSAAASALASSFAWPFLFVFLLRLGDPMKGAEHDQGGQNESMSIGPRWIVDFLTIGRDANRLRTILGLADRCAALYRTS